MLACDLIAMIRSVLVEQTIHHLERLCSLLPKRPYMDGRWLLCKVVTLPPRV